MAGEFLSFVLRIGSTAVLARLLMPEDFGLISMVTALTIIAERFKDLGLADATIQRKEITHQQVSTLFWINVSFGIFIMLIISALSPIIASFYKDTRLVWITIALSSSFFFGGLTIQHDALLRRQMLLVRRACIQIISTTLSIAIAIVLALQGYEYWALVGKEISRSVFVAVGTCLAYRWLPGLPKYSSIINSMIRFGGNITGFNIIYFFSYSTDLILLGRFWGARPLGFYRLANQLIMPTVSQFLYPINSVALPALSALQNEPDKFLQYYKKLISIFSFLYMPVVIYLGIFSESIVRLLFGDKWIDSAVILRILAIGILIQPVASTCRFVMIAYGKSKRYLWWGAINSICMVIGFCIGIYWGPIGVATAYAINAYAILVPTLWYGFNKTPISISEFFRSISLPAFASLIMGIFLILLFKIVPLKNTIEILISLPLASFIYFGIWWLLFPSGKQLFREYLSYLISILKPTP